MKDRFKNLFTTKKVIILIVVAVLVALVGINARNQTEKKTEDTQNTLKTSLRLKWINQAQFAGYYMASSEGYYEKDNLEVRIDPAGPNISPIQMVATGVNEFGIAGADEILKARAKGIPLVAVAVVFKENPIALNSLKESGINEPKDLIGKRIAVVYGNDENLYREFLRRHNIDKSQVTEIAAVPGASQLLSNQADVVMAYSMNVPVQLKLQGKETNVIKFSEHGVKFYGDTLFTTEEMIKNNPHKVRKFVQATVEGWKSAAADRNGAINEVMSKNPSLNREAQLGYLDGVIPIIGEGGAISTADTSVWEYMQDTLLRLGVIEQKVDINEVFTNEFISR